jgi:hypothetical protein
MKTVNTLTIKEYNKYLELIADENFDTFALLELFGYDLDKLSIQKMQSLLSTLIKEELKVNKLNRYYKVGKWTLKANLNLTKISAAQFIDLQNYLQEFKLEQVLSVFLIPCKKTMFGYKQMSYADSNEYDVVALQDDLLNHMKISDANTLSSFFFAQSMNLLKVTKAYLEKKLMKKKMNQLKIDLKELKSKNLQ